MDNSREIILESLLELEKTDVYSNVLLRQVLHKYNYLPAQEKAFIKRVTEGTTERRIELDYVLDQFSNTPVSKMKPFIRNLMRMSVYQLLYMDAVPDSAVCNEAVKLAQKRHFQALKGFVNGVLRNIARQKKEIAYPDKENDWKKALSVRFSMPEWILDLWDREYGKEQTISMTKALLTIQPVSIRITESLSETEQERLAETWKKQGISCERHPYLSYARRCRNLDGISELPGFAEGRITVQDVSSMLVTECAGIGQGDFVLDVCAAPGGKSLHAADKIQRLGREEEKNTACRTKQEDELTCQIGEYKETEKGGVEARDISEEKVSLIRENAARMKCKNLSVKVWDACRFDADMEEKADVLYLDVPCSGLGIMGKKRDIKYHVTEESMVELVRLQQEIVRTCWRYVKPGGVILYSTCTIHKEENEKQVEWMCGEFPLHTESLNPFLPEMIRCEEAESGMLQLVPGKHDCDGFFLARMRREA